MEVVGIHMNKKGMSYKTIVAVIVFLAGAVIVLVFSGAFDKLILQPLVGGTPCEIALGFTHAKANIPGITAKLEDLKKFCSPEKRNMNLVFEKENVNEMNKKITEALIDCLNLMEKSGDLAESNWFTEKVACFTCATISFKGNAVNNYNEPLLNWLENNRIGEQTYKEFLDQYSENKILFSGKKVILSSIPTLNPKLKYKIYAVKPVLESLELIKARPKATVLIGTAEEYKKYVVVNE